MHCCDTEVRWLKRKHFDCRFRITAVQSVWRIRNSLECFLSKPGFILVRSQSLHLIKQKELSSGYSLSLFMKNKKSQKLFLVKRFLKKGIPNNLNFISLFTQPHVILNLYVVIFSEEHEMRIWRTSYNHNYPLSPCLLTEKHDFVTQHLFFIF